MPDMGQKCLGRVFIRQKMHSSGEKRGKKALIRGLPDMAFRKFPTCSTTSSLPLSSDLYTCRTLHPCVYLRPHTPSAVKIGPFKQTRFDFCSASAVCQTWTPLEIKDTRLHDTLALVIGHRLLPSSLATIVFKHISLYSSTRLGFQATSAYHVFKVSLNVRIGFHVTTSNSIKNSGWVD